MNSETATAGLNVFCHQAVKMGTVRRILTILNLLISGFLLAVPLHAQTTSEAPTLTMFTQDDTPVYACVETDCEMIGTIPPWTRVQVTDLLPGRDVVGKRLWYEILWPIQPELADFSSRLLVHAPFTRSSQDNGFVRAMAWSPDGTRVATQNTLGEQVIWDVISRQFSVMPEVSVPDEVEYVQFSSIAWSPDSTRIAFASTGFRGSDLDIRDSNSGEHLTRLSQWGRDKDLVAVTWTATRAFYVSADSDNNTVLIGDAMSGEELSSLDIPSFLLNSRGYWDAGNTMILSPDGTGLVTLVPFRNIDYSDDTILNHSRDVLVWNTGNGSHLTLKGHPYVVRDAAWSSDGSRIASTSPGGMLVHDTDSGEILAVSARLVQNLGLLSVTWSPDGSRIATGGINGNLFIWNATNGELLDASWVLSYMITDLAWSPDGARIAVIGNSGASLRIIDLPPPVEVRRAFVHSSQLGTG